jgi:hypothetical protein
MIKNVEIGDVVTVDTGNHLFARLIRFGELIKGTPTHIDHVVIVHHNDAAGTWWGIEARPGGVGYVDMNLYLDSPFARYGNSNAAQPRTDAQRTAIAAVAGSMLGVEYDWKGGIAADALDAFHADKVADELDKFWGWKDPSNPRIRPAHVVCSSLAAWIYGELGLGRPAVTDEERCTPADWWTFNHRLSQQS